MIPIEGRFCLLKKSQCHEIDEVSYFTSVATYYQKRKYENASISTKGVLRFQSSFYITASLTEHANDPLLSLISIICPTK